MGLANPRNSSDTRAASSLQLQTGTLWCVEVRNTSAYFTSCLVVKGQAKINTVIQFKLKVVMGVYVIFLANAELA